MNYLRGAISAASQYYKDLPPINPSTLTGAIDVIVIRRPGEDGETELACSPFHVRFGKWQVLRPGEKKVNVVVNGLPIPFNMKIGDAGEAFFIFETEEDIPEDLITSPLLEPTESDQSHPDITTSPFGGKEHVENEGVGVSNDHDKDQSLPEPEFLDLDASSHLSDHPEALKTPRLSGLSLSRPSDDGNQRDASSSTVGPSSVLSRTARLGKAIVTAAVEQGQENELKLVDKVESAKNIANRGYKSTVDDMVHRGKTRPMLNERGDEALPEVKDGEGSPPPVVYNDDIVLDISGYHSKEESDQTITSEVNEKVPRLSTLDLRDNHSTPKSSRDRTPPSSGSNSPDSDGSSGSALKPRLLSQEIPSVRASSEPPDGIPANSPPQYSWEWGAFPQRSPMKMKFTHSHDNSDNCRSVSVPPELESERTPSALTFDTRKAEHISSSFGEGGDLTADEEDGKLFLLHLGAQTYSFELSTCGKLSGGRDEVGDSRTFKDNQISYRRFMKSSEVINNKNLVMRWNDRYISREDGSPLLASLVTWRDAALAKPANGRNSADEEPLSSSDEREPEDTNRISPSKTVHPRGSSSWVRWWKLSRSEHETPTRTSTEGGRPKIQPSNSVPFEPGHIIPEVPQPVPPRVDAGSSSTTALDVAKRYAKTLRLTSEQLKALDLKTGSNTITFSLSASGAVACTAQIFLWDSTDQIVISDIDGTITKSDALGHVFTMIGRDWTHIGVAKLYTDICRNGYKIMYLTSRAIGQADSTRDYLKGINQNNYQLPEGPVVMSPDRLMASLHREVIMRKPEMFKMACLRDIQRLFGHTSSNPFYAGFGNRITDALSYRSVNVPSARIFTIDSTGEVKMELLELAGYKSSYIHMTDLVDQMFPPIHRTWAPEFTDFNYWKRPIGEFPLPDLTPPSPALSARSDTSNQSTFSRIRNFSLGRQSSGQFTLPSPITQKSPADQEHRLRQMSSFERLASRLTGNLEPSGESSESTLVESESERDKRAQKRLSTGSMPGSLPGSLGSHGDFPFAQEDEDEEGDLEEGGRDYEEGEVLEDEDEDAEAAFDDDLLATGEMENVPFL